LSQVYRLILDENPAEGVWLTIDGWTSRAGQSYCGIIVHFLTLNFSPVSLLLSTIPTNDHDANSVAESVTSTLKVWELEKMVEGMVGDNTRSVPKTAQIIAEDPDFEEFEFWGCAAHLLNLVVKHSLDLVR